MLLRAQLDLHTSPFQRNALAQSMSQKRVVVHSRFAWQRSGYCYSAAATAAAKQLAVQHFPHSSVSITVAVLTQQVQQFTQWVSELKQRLQANPAAQAQQNQAILTEKELKIDWFGGNRCHNWSDDIKAILGVRRPEQGRTEVGRKETRSSH